MNYAFATFAAVIWLFAFQVFRAGMGWHGAGGAISALFSIGVGILIFRIVLKKFGASSPLQVGAKNAADDKSEELAACASQEMEMASAQRITSERPSNQSLEGNQNLDIDSVVYDSIAAELDQGPIDRGLWIRLYAECDGDEVKTKVEYIKFRAEILRAQVKSEKAAELSENQLQASREKEARERIELAQRRSTIASLLSQGRLDAISIPKDVDRFVAAVVNGFDNDVSAMLEDDPAYLAYLDPKHGNTALHIAIVNKHPSTALLLIEYGAPTTIKNSYGFTPAQVANEKGYNEVTQAISEFSGAMKNSDKGSA